MELKQSTPLSGKGWEMWADIKAILRSWSILLVGGCLILGGLVLAAGQATVPGSMTPSSPEQNMQPERQAAAPPPAETKKPAETRASPPAGSNAPAAAAKSNSTPAAQAPAQPPHSAAAEPPAPPDRNRAQSSSPPASAQTAQAQRPPTPVAAAANVSGDAAAGRQVFRKCQACHSMEPGKNILGPSLAGIIGRKAGGVAGYNYSPAMKQADITWDAKTLDAYLADPQKTVPGNKMPFPGLKTEHDRTDVIAFMASAGSAGTQAAAAPAQANTPAPAAAAPPQQNAAPAAPQPQDAPAADIGYIPDARYTLRSGIAEGRMVFIGVGGAIEGKVNPLLTAADGQVVQLTLINGEGAEHDIVFPDQDAKSPRVTGRGSSTTIAFRATKAGDFIYFCSVPGHQLAGMQGQFIVTSRPAPQTLVEADISREPTDLPPPIGKREPQTVRVDLLSVEIEGRLAEGTTFGYWTFNGKVPGPFIRVRVGDIIDIHLKNSADSSMIHSVDFHAATGPGGGAASL